MKINGWYKRNCFIGSHLNVPNSVVIAVCLDANIMMYSSAVSVADLTHSDTIKSGKWILYTHRSVSPFSQ